MFNVLNLFKKKEVVLTKEQKICRQIERIYKLARIVANSKHLRVKTNAPGGHFYIRLNTAQGDRVFNFTCSCFADYTSIRMCNPYKKGATEFDIVCDCIGSKVTDYILKVNSTISPTSKNYVMSFNEIELALYELETNLTRLHQEHVYHEEKHTKLLRLELKK